MTMKRIIGAALALTLLGSTAAEARGWGHGGYHHGGGDAALGIGLGILALGVIAAESSHHHDRYRDRDRYYDRDGDRDRDGYRDRDNYRDRDRDSDRGNRYDGDE